MRQNAKTLLLKKKFGPVPLSGVILLAALCITLLHNYTLFARVAGAYPGQYLFQAASVIVFFCLNVALLNLVAFRRAAKPVLAFLLVFSAAQAYFTDSFGVIGDQEMIRNILWTDPREVAGWFNLRLGAYLAFLGLAPALLVWMAPIRKAPLRRELIIKLRDITAALGVMVVCLLVFGASYASLFREHKLIRHYANPAFFIYSSGRLAYREATYSNPVVAALGAEAAVAAQDDGRELIIMVVGETARADRFSLLGYGRETNPLLAREDLVAFSDVDSCGTSTVISVPCMFSNFGRAEFTSEKAAATENLLDMLTHTGKVNVLWRDNNSDSKGVALRVPYQDFRTQTFNPVCDLECRDEGLLAGLQEYIDSRPEGDFFIVLHQLGNHGPEYYKRYPEKFEVFKPVCKSGDLGQCSREEISNAYDNAILYTDYFLAQTIAFLKKNDGRFETALFYVSDHGESLGENGLYLHGMPYALSPAVQRKVPMIAWFGESIRHEIDLPAIRARVHDPFSHDNVFHSMLGLLEIDTPLYDPEKDIFKDRPVITARPAPAAAPGSGVN